MEINSTESYNWVKDNAWMVLFWILNAKPKECDRMQEFCGHTNIELNETNYQLAQCHPLEISKNLLMSILYAIVFGKENKFPVCIEGYYSKFGKYPKVGDVQLYHSNLQQTDTKSGDPEQRLYQNTISIMLDWEFKNGS